MTRVKIRKVSAFLKELCFVACDDDEIVGRGKIVSYNVFVERGIFMINDEIVIKTKRLNMRRFNENDLDYLYEITSNPSVMRYFPKTLDRAETDDLLHKIVKNYELKGTSFWAAFTNETNDFVGMCGLLQQTIDNLEELEIAYRIVEKYWCNGYATELAEACRDNALNILGKERVISLIRPDNIPSKKVATKIGLKYSKNVNFLDLEHELYCMNKVL